MSSKHWEVSHTFRGVYRGGDVQLVPPARGRSARAASSRARSAATSRSRAARPARCSAGCTTARERGQRGAIDAFRATRGAAALFAGTRA